MEEKELMGPVVGLNKGLEDPIDVDAFETNAGSLMVRVSEDDINRVYHGWHGPLGHTRKSTDKSVGKADLSKFSKICITPGDEPDCH